MIIFLYGASGSGKSTLGRELARTLDLNFLDLDAQIELDLGESIAKTIARHGEEFFRDAETAALNRATDSPPTLRGVRGGIIALGGGALLRQKNRQLAEESGKIVFLEASAETLAKRLAQDENKRPLLAGDLEKKLGALLEKRKAHYASFPLRVDANREKSEILWDIQRELGCFRAKSMGAGYDILIREGGIDHIGEKMRERGLRAPLLLVSDSNVSPIYAERALKSLRSAGYSAQSTVIPAGEAHKTLETVSGLWRAALNAGLDRKSTIVSLGGGMTSDLAGFTAATFMRGCNWVALPTSLLAMVDASMGGKTGFDLPEGKNLVGAFHPPRLVLADPETLATLPDRELRAGLAETLKHGVIADAKLFNSFTTKAHLEKKELTEIVRRGMAVKIKIIEEDPYEGGIRAALNFGHTIGHAVELVSGFDLLHGEAVAIGMVAETRLAEKLGIAERGLATLIAETLANLGLPTEIPNHFSRPDLIRAMKMDKKKSAGMVKFALPVSIGKMKVGVEIEDLAESI
jgi:3-dehydroquinate synthase